MKDLLKYLKKYKGKVILSMLFVTIASISTLALPKIVEKVIQNGVLAKGGPDKLLMEKYGVIMIAIAVIGLITGTINSYFSSFLSQSVGSDMRKAGFSRIQQYSYEDIEKFKSSNLVVRLTNDINQIQMIVLLMFTTLLRMPIIFVGSFTLAMYTIPELWYIVILVLVLVVLVLAIVMRKMIPMFGKVQKKVDKINTVIKENFEGARVVKSFVKEKDEEEKFDVENNDLANFTKKIGHIFSVVMPAFFFIVNIATAAVIFLSSSLAEKDPAIIGSIVAYINYLSQLMMAILIGGAVMIQFSRALVSVKRYSEIMEVEPSIIYPSKGIEKIKGNVEFKNVTFAYPNDNVNSIEDISFKVNKGETIGIVGATGSGKSTIVHLLLRLFDVKKGEILIDDVCIKDIPKDTLRNGISIVLQKPILFSGTIKENIDYVEKQPEDKIVEALENSQALEFVGKLPETYNSEVLQRGANFSGGQKQRLSIARGLVGDPSIVVLDDSTSALDSRSEKLVKEALYSKYKGKTIFMIAQKIASVVDADKILVIDNGHLESIGTHNELVEKSPVYREIYETQKGAE